MKNTIQAFALLIPSLLIASAITLILQLFTVAGEGRIMGMMMFVEILVYGCLMFWTNHKWGWLDASNN